MIWRGCMPRRSGATTPYRVRLVINKVWARGPDSDNKDNNHSEDNTQAGQSVPWDESAKVESKA
eukprot:scaffold255764_cov33-Prasinocladus_malaysianus.AAC.1